MTGPRALDHLVLPTASLAIARQRLGRLGFTMAPDGVHPFGTVNCCVYLADGTFLEPLAIGDPHAVDKAVGQGNSFVAGDRRFRAAHGDEGFSAIVLTTDDAEADSRRFERHRIGGGPMVEFTRPSIDLAGNADNASFLLAFAAHRSAPDLFFFTCERRRSPRIDRGALQRHANGATAIAAIDATSPQPQDLTGFLARFAEAPTAETTQGSDISIGKHTIRVSGTGTPPEARLVGITFVVDSIASTADLFRANAVVYTDRGNALTVRAEAGQGADFTFQEAP